jgi:hypothetical protein
MTMIALALGVSVAGAADPARSDPTIRIEVGEVNVRDTANRFSVRDLDLAHCTVSAPAANTPAPKAPVAEDRIVLDVVVRDHRTERIAISAIDPSYAWLEPCVETALFTQRWPIANGRLEVPIILERPTERGPDPNVVAPPPPR